MTPIQLPNGDMWMGPDDRPREDTVDAQPDPAPDAVEDALKAPKLTCPWCGSVWAHKTPFKNHIVKQHGRHIGESAETARQSGGSISVAPKTANMGIVGG